VAMACPGTELYDVVATRGVVVPPEDVSALVAAIEGLASDPMRRAALGAAGREYAERCLSSANVFDALGAKLAQLCGREYVSARGAQLPGASDAASQETRASTPLEPTQVD
jgi:colanic acid biosynthesis glycosyl transferase WcaI